MIDAKLVTGDDIKIVDGLIASNKDYIENVEIELSKRASEMHVDISNLAGGMKAIINESADTKALLLDRIAKLAEAVSLDQAELRGMIQALQDKIDPPVVTPPARPLRRIGPGAVALFDSLNNFIVNKEGEPRVCLAIKSTHTGMLKRINLYFADGSAGYAAGNGGKIQVLMARSLDPGAAIIGSSYPLDFSMTGGLFDWGKSNKSAKIQGPYASIEINPTSGGAQVQEGEMCYFRIEPYSGNGKADYISINTGVTWRMSEPHPRSMIEEVVYRDGKGAGLDVHGIPSRTSLIYGLVFGDGYVQQQPYVAVTAAPSQMRLLDGKSWAGQQWRATEGLNLKRLLVRVFRITDTPARLRASLWIGDTFHERVIDVSDLPVRPSEAGNSPDYRSSHTVAFGYEPLPVIIKPGDNCKLTLQADAGMIAAVAMQDASNSFGGKWDSYKANGNAIWGSTLAEAKGWDGWSNASADKGEKQDWDLAFCLEGE